MAPQQWQPAADVAALRTRARLLGGLRRFLDGRGVLEVDTPLLMRSTATAPRLDSMMLRRGGVPWFLQTSPEFAMKRLVAACGLPVWQICKAFREGECGSRHNPEFTMLEWYRPGFELQQLVDEVVALLRAVAGDFAGCALTAAPLRQCSWAALFERHCGIDPLAATDAEVVACGRRLVSDAPSLPGRDDWLDLLFSHCVAPAVAGLLVVCDFPPSQAALARLGTDGQGRTVARRFEVYWNGCELANGYDELTDAAEQRRRFEADNRQRRLYGFPELPVDERLLAALEALPPTAGVAVGVDRLLQVVSGADDLRRLIAFPEGLA